jgi:3-isopropylmalate/(R)-2-methylmalate dehydratase large subunit
MVECDLVLANDVSGPLAFHALEEMNVDKVFDPEKVVMIPDHFMPAKDEKSAELQKVLRDWSHRHGVIFLEQGRGGIEHAVLVENGWVVPGMVIAGGDSHTCTYGALGAFGTGLGSTDIAAALAFGTFWQRVPETLCVEFSGQRRRFVTGKDFILAVIDRIGVAGGTNRVLEFTGPAVQDMDIDERLAVSNMAVEAGAETGLFPADAVTAAFLEGRSARTWRREQSDHDAEFCGRIQIDLSDLSPLVAMPHSPGNVSSLSKILGNRVDQVYIGNCANGTITDLRQAASILRGRKVHHGSRVIIVPGSQKIYRQAMAEGLLDIFVEAGAIVSTPTCGACFGGHMGILAAGEFAVTTTNRNFRGRMGSPKAGVYLANAYVAASAAVAGELVDPADIVGEAKA